MAWLGLCLLGVEAWGADIDSRVRLSDALLAEARGDIETALARYTELSRTLPDDDPTLSEALYWMGHALYMLGRVEEAREALQDGIRNGHCQRCRDLREMIDLEEAAITTLPVRWTFEGPHGLFHPWRMAALGGRSIRIASRPDTNPALEWRTSPRPEEPDHLKLALRQPTPAPALLRVSVLSKDGDSLLDVVAEDDRGQRYALLAPRPLPRGELRTIEVALKELVPLDPAPSARSLDASRLVWLSLVDRTGMRAGGANTLWIDDFELR